MENSLGDSKYWICPDGKLVPTKGEYHYRFLKGHLPLAKKYGLDVDFLKSTDDENDVRFHALSKGFYRINHQHKDSDVVIEGRPEFLDNKKKNIRSFVRLNKNKINNLTITLLDKKKVYKTETVNLYKNPREKIPFMDE